MVEAVRHRLTVVDDPQSRRLRGPALRRGLLGLIPAFYGITVVARLLGGVSMPSALWDLGPYASSFVNTSLFIVALVIAHRLVVGRA
jgi:hypothetical protein